jgi:hypothetical protein
MASYSDSTNGNDNMVTMLIHIDQKVMESNYKWLKVGPENPKHRYM